MLGAYLKRQWKLIFMLAAFACLSGAVFWLYRLPVESVLYAAALCMALGLLLFAVSYIRFRQKHKELEWLLRQARERVLPLPPPRGLLEEDYQALLKAVCKDRAAIAQENDVCLQEMTDYYTLWAHQIKTPIASMRLNLQNQDSEFARRILEDLARIERYVEMVMGYLRLDSDFTDYVIREYDLDEIVKQTVKKFAGQFIRKKLQLDYRPLHTRAVTDEKWLQFVLEQVISNSLKYTESGRITIEMESDAMAKEAGDAILCIRDTGIGIAPEDIPRIFEKGYTGYNGRSDKKASGIGLYLCRRICDNLGHVITANSSLENGTVIRIRFKGPRSR